MNNNEQWQHNEELLKSCIKDSSTYAQILRKIGIRDSGCNYRSLRRALKRFKIEFSPNNIYRQSSKKIELSEILVEHSTYTNTKKLKRRLIKEGHLEEKCYNCNLREWLSKSIPLQLEHKNGRRTDCRPENLTLLCPNCHAQTETYCGKNKGKYKEASEIKEKVMMQRINAKIEDIKDIQIINDEVIDNLSLKWGTGTRAVKRFLEKHKSVLMEAWQRGL